MKSLAKKFVMLSLVVLFSQPLFAGNLPAAQVQVGRAQTFILNLEKFNDRPATIRLVDADGVTLFTEKAEQANTWVRKYNVRQLPAGKYNLEIEQTHRLILQPIRLTNTSLYVDLQKQKEFFKPSVQRNGDWLDLTVLNVSEARVSYRILGRSGETLYSESTNEEGSIMKRFDISELPAGNYQLVIRTRGKSYFEPFVIAE